MSFEFRPASRESIWLLVGFAGGTGSGKTYSAMRLAKGIAGDREFAVIDTEAGRAKHYAAKDRNRPRPGEFLFQHLDFSPPFSPDRYVNAVLAAEKAGFPCVVIDSVSHEHAGDGGLLDMQEDELTRMAGTDWKKRENSRMASWIKPKMEHKKFLSRLLQVRMHVIMCFRAEEKIEMVKVDGKMKVQPKASLTGYQGWIPVCEKNLPFELTASFMFLAEKPGYPHPIKLQEQHKELFPLDKQITEDSGRNLVLWATGDEGQDVLEKIRTATTLEELEAAGLLARSVPQSMKAELREAYLSRKVELSGEETQDTNPHSGEESQT
jgi:hypothetical protein